MTLRDIFIQSFLAANPNLNVAPNYPCYDTLIAPLSRAFSDLGARMDNLEALVNYANFFDEQGRLIPGRFDILKNNLLLGDGIATRGLVTIYLEYGALQNQIEIPENYVIVKDDARFVLPSGTFVLPVSIRNGRFNYALQAVSVELEQVVVTAGNWLPETALLPGLQRMYSMVNSTVGTENAGRLTQEDIVTIMGSKGSDTPGSILYGMTRLFNQTNVVPQRIDISTFRDETYMSGIAPFTVEEGEDDTSVQVFRYGGYADIRAHKGFEEAVFYLRGVEIFEGYCEFDMTIPVYSIVEVRNWIGGELGSTIPYEYDYTRKILRTSFDKIRVTVLTTNLNLTNGVKSFIHTHNGIGGTLKLQQYHPVFLYVDHTCLNGGDPAVDANLVAAINDTLYEATGEDSSMEMADFVTLESELAQKHGLETRLQKILWLNPSTVPAGEPDSGELTTLEPTLPDTLEVYTGPEGIPYPIPLTSENTLIIGGRNS